MFSTDTGKVDEYNIVLNDVLYSCFFSLCSITVGFEWNHMIIVLGCHANGLILFHFPFPSLSLSMQGINLALCSVPHRLAGLSSEWINLLPVLSQNSLS